MLSPRWSHRPLSGERGAKRGGRWNAPGLRALYVGSVQYEQDLGIRLGTLCAYDVDADGIADLNDLVTVRAIGVEPADLECPWKQIALVDKK